MKKSALSLQTTLTTALLGLAVLGMVVSGALVAMTTYLHWTGAMLWDALESVHLTQAAEIRLLLHEEAVDPARKREIEEALRRALAGTREHALNGAEERVLREAEVQVDLYLAASREERRGPDLARRHESAVSALQALVNENVAQARSAQDEASRWGLLADMLGAVTALLPLLLAGWLLWWLRARVMRPLLTLAGAMERFAGGERDVRADEDGPIEIRRMGERFNAMAQSLAAQREVQMAFLAGVAHDLRNPLSALGLAAATIRPDRPVPPEARLRRTVEVIQRQLGRMDRMVGDFLDMARIEAGQLDLHIETADAGRLVREAAELFEAAAPAHRIETSLPGHAVPVQCDPLRIEQVLTNLISNAIKYSPAGGAVLVTLALAADNVVISVEDHGLGMSEDDCRRIFEPFQRPGLASNAAPGIGLGLFIVKRIVEAHGGRVEVESAPGHGSTFRVRLPASAGCDQEK